jgi:hypothetical protein
MRQTHKGLLACECGGRIVSVFANTTYSGYTKLGKIDGFGYCMQCNNIFRIEVKKI